MIVFGSDIINKYGVKVNKGSVVVNEGDKTRDMFIVHKGELEVVRIVNGKEAILKNITDGEFFGELSLLNNEPRAATVRAVQPSVLIKISPDGFETLVKRMPELALKVIMVLASRLRQKNQEVINMQEKDDDIRLFKSIIAKIDSLGVECAKGIKVNVDIEKIGDEINVEKEIVKKVKNDLDLAQNIINFNENGGFIVKNKDLLGEFVDFIKSRNKYLG